MPRPPLNNVPETAAGRVKLKFDRLLDSPSCQPVNQKTTPPRRQETGGPSRVFWNNQKSTNTTKLQKSEPASRGFWRNCNNWSFPVSMKFRNRRRGLRSDTRHLSPSFLRSSTRLQNQALHMVLSASPSANRVTCPDLCTHFLWFTQSFILSSSYSLHHDKVAPPLLDPTLCWFCSSSPPGSG